MYEFSKYAIYLAGQCQPSTQKATYLNTKIIYLIRAYNNYISPPHGMKILNFGFYGKTYLPWWIYSDERDENVWLDPQAL